MPHLTFANRANSSRMPNIIGESSSLPTTDVALDSTAGEFLKESGVLFEFAAVSPPVSKGFSN